MVQKLIDKLRRTKPKYVRPTHDLLCDCRNCMRSQLRYIKDLKKAFESEMTMTQLTEQQVLETIRARVQEIMDLYEIDDDNLTAALLDAVQVGMDIAEQEYEKVFDNGINHG